VTSIRLCRVDKPTDHRGLREHATRAYVNFQDAGSAELAREAMHGQWTPDRGGRCGAVAALCAAHAPPLPLAHYRATLRARWFLSLSLCSAMISHSCFVAEPLARRPVREGRTGARGKRRRSQRRRSAQSESLKRKFNPVFPEHRTRVQLNQKKHRPNNSKSPMR
jgi:hypothetical protein